jgi:hypothetical protein
MSGPPPSRLATSTDAGQNGQQSAAGQQPQTRQAQPRRSADLTYVPDIRRGTSAQLTNADRVGAQPHVAVPRPAQPRPGYDNQWNRNGYRVYAPYGNKHNYYRYYPYKSYSYARPYYYYPYAFGYGPYGRGYFYFDLFYNSYVFYPTTAARYDNSGTYGYPTGALRLQVQPRDAQVFIDGSYAGIVDDFDGTFQSLRLEQGEYKVEIALPGFEPLDFDVRITAGQTITYRGDLIPEQPQQP